MMAYDVEKWLMVVNDGQDGQRWLPCWIVHHFEKNPLIFPLAGPGLRLGRGQCSQRAA